MAQAIVDLMDGWWDTVGCPDCQGALRPGYGEQLVCRGCGAHFAVEGQVLLLMRPEDGITLAGFGQSYRQARLQDGWQPLTSEQALKLPYESPDGYRPLYWEIRRQSYHRLVRFLKEEGPLPGAGPVADLGAGVGWLGFRLARSGYRVFAVDASLDNAFGLGAARPYVVASEGRLLLAQGNLEYPPLRKGQCSLVVFNASLHYAQDLKATLFRAARTLQPGGRLIVLDTPIARRPVLGTGRGDRHLGRRELHDALVSAGLCTRRLLVWRGPRWWAYRAKSWLKRSAPFSFPMVVAVRG